VVTIAAHWMKLGVSGIVRPGRIAIHRCIQFFCIRDSVFVGVGQGGSDCERRPIQGLVNDRSTVGLIFSTLTVRADQLDTEGITLQIGAYDCPSLFLVRFRQSRQSIVLIGTALDKLDFASIS